MLYEINSVDEYIERLKHHDWFYDYSDDHSVWTRGRKDRGAIDSAQKRYDPDHALWNQYCPEMFLYKR